MRVSWAGQLVQVAGRNTARRYLAQCGDLGAATREGVRTAGMEMASGRRRQRRGNFSPDGNVGAALRIDPRHLGDDRLGGMMGWLRVNLHGRPGLDHASVL